MTSFIFIALLITLVTLGLLLWPLRKNRNSISYARQAQNIHYAKERIQELDEQLENASISATDYEALKLEIENTLADDIDIANQNSENETVLNTPQSNKLVIILLCTILPISALGFYYFAGTPESFALAKLSSAEQQQKLSPKGQSKSTPEEVNQMLATIEARLKDNPNDAKGWDVLASTYLKIGRYEDAKRSISNLMRIEGQSADLLISMADATGRAAGGNLIGEPQRLLRKALVINPKAPQALFMMGLSAVQEQDNATAIEYWDRLLPLLNNSPKQQQELAQLISSARTGLGLPATGEPATGETSSTTVGSKQNAPTKSQVKPNQATSNNESIIEDENTNGGVRVSVSIDPSMLEKAKPSDLVFVIAKATKGPPAPLAVKRLTVADLPTTVSLNDSDAMIEQFKVSLFENISISARIARSGNPVAQTGDIESDKVDVKNTTTEEIKLIISSEIK